MDEGYIKFQCCLIKSSPPPPSEITKLQEWRTKLFALKLIGAYANGIGYGNISERREGEQFVITGSATGKYALLNPEHYSKVTDFNPALNTLTCEGETKASSESMTHGMIYRLDKQVRAVIHIHHLALWQKLLNKVPTSSVQVPYGTPHMAEEIERLFSHSNLQKQKILAMAGHEEGIITFGKSLDEAGKVLVDHYSKFVGPL